MNFNEQLPLKATRNVPSYKTISEELSSQVIVLQAELQELKRQKTLDTFQQEAWTFQMPTSMNTEYLGLGLTAEAGEVAGLLAKARRDGVSGAIYAKDNIAKELGDVLWFVACLAFYHDLPLSVIAQGNINKLTDRKARGVIGGNGDNR